MSRYLLLFLLNVPFVIAAFVSTIVNYKLGRITKTILALRLLFWTTILLGLIFAQSIYEFLFSNHLTETEPLSLFDVIQITGIIVVFYIANRSREKIDHLERRVQDLHRELSIKLSKKD